MQSPDMTIKKDQSEKKRNISNLIDSGRLFKIQIFDKTVTLNWQQQYICVNWLAFNFQNSFFAPLSNFKIGFRKTICNKL